MWYRVFLLLALLALLAVGEGRSMWGSRRKKDDPKKTTAVPPPRTRTKRTDSFKTEWKKNIDSTLSQLEAFLQSGLHKQFLDDSTLQLFHSELLKATDDPTLLNVINSISIDNIDEFTIQLLEGIKLLRENDDQIFSMLSDPQQLQSILQHVPAEYVELVKAVVMGENIEKIKKLVLNSDSEW
jgi:hypothetical protein